MEVLLDRLAIECFVEMGRPAGLVPGPATDRAGSAPSMGAKRSRGSPRLAEAGRDHRGYGAAQDGV